MENVKADVQSGINIVAVGIDKRMAFWDGIGPKLARAIVNHAVTFLVFDNLCFLWLSIVHGAR